MSVAELIHGIWRAKDAGIRGRREEFVAELLWRVPVALMTVATARIYGYLDATTRVRGITILSADLVIASTAIEHGSAVVKADVRHYRLAPRLKIHLVS